MMFSTIEIASDVWRACVIAVGEQVRDFLFSFSA
jgi:hypothetical protein